MAKAKTNASGSFVKSHSKLSKLQNINVNDNINKTIGEVPDPEDNLAKDNSKELDTTSKRELEIWN